MYNETAFVIVAAMAGYGFGHAISTQIINLIKVLGR